MRIRGACACCVPIMLLLTGCAALRGKGSAEEAAAPPPVAIREQPQDDLGAFLEWASTGETRQIVLDGMRVRVTAGERFTAASGRDCRLLRVSDQAARNVEAGTRVACRTAQGWRLARAVLSTAIVR